MGYEAESDTGSEYGLSAHDQGGGQVEYDHGGKDDQVEDQIARAPTGEGDQGGGKGEHDRTGEEDQAGEDDQVGPDRGERGQFPASTPASTSTGEPRVDAALGRLSELDELPVSEHPAVFERVHGQLVEVLGELHHGSEQR